METIPEVRLAQLLLPAFKRRELMRLKFVLYRHIYELHKDQLGRSDKVIYKYEGNCGCLRPPCFLHAPLSLLEVDDRLLCLCFADLGFQLHNTAAVCLSLLDLQYLGIGNSRTTAHQHR